MRLGFVIFCNRFPQTIGSASAKSLWLRLEDELHFPQSIRPAACNEDEISLAEDTPPRRLDPADVTKMREPRVYCSFPITP